MNNFKVPPYSQGIQSDVIDAVSHTNLRSEFHIDSGKVMLSSLRLTNLGVIDGAAAATNPNNKMLDPIGGVMGIIKNIYLMDGGLVLDQMLNSPVIGTFKEHNNNNDKMVSVNSRLSGASMGMSQELDALSPITAVAAGVKNSNVVREDKFIILPVNPDPGAGTAADDIAYTTTSVFRYNIDNTNKTTCHLDLSKCFNLLNNLNVLSTNVFKNLRVVVEYQDLNKCALLISYVNTTDPSYVPSITGIQRPSLLVDYIVNEKLAMMKENELMGRTVNYKVLESDSINNTSNVTGNIFSSKVYGFNDKTLLRLACFKQNPALLSQSLAHNGETINFVVNGKQFLPYTGIDAKNKSLCYLTESWGDFGMKGDENEPTKRILNARKLTNNTYTGVLVGRRVDELLVNYSNSAGAGTTMNFVVIGEVVKSLMINNNGSYVVSYA